MISSKAAVVDRSGEAINLHFKFVYTRSLAPFGRNTSCLRRPSPLACAVDHAAAFAVNAALVVSQWQKLSARSFPLHPSLNAEHEAGQAASIDF